MEPVVPAEITAELTQILSNLVLGDNAIRKSAEKAVDERLAHTPDLYLLALAQFAIAADTEVMRSFSLVLLRRLLFRSAPNSGQDSNHNPSDHLQNSQHPAHRITLYDHLAAHTLSTLERLLLHSLSHEPSRNVRNKTVDTICDVANQGMSRGRPWHALQAQVFSMAQSAEMAGVEGAGMREAAYLVFTGCPNLVMDLQTDAVLVVFQKGLQDTTSLEVRHAALLASVAYLTAADPPQLQQSLSLMYPMLETLPPLAISHPPVSSYLPTGPQKSNHGSLTEFLSTLTPLASSHPTLFAPHLNALLAFLPSLILPRIDSGPTPTVAQPFPGERTGSRAQSSVMLMSPPPTPSTATPSTSTPRLNLNTNFVSSPAPTATSFSSMDGDSDADISSLRLGALEFMVSLSEARPSMVKNVEGWVPTLVRACLEGMAEIEEDEDGAADLAEWLAEDPMANSTDSDSNPALYEQSLDRLACALGGRFVLPPAFHIIPSMLASYDWRSRHAGLMAIAAIAEGTGKVMQNELGKIVDLVTPMFKDTHPRVRHAACQCVGQLCTDLEELIQEQYHNQLFQVLIPALEDPEPRVHSHAAAALINFCEGVERETLLPYLDPIVERLLRLLNPGGEQDKQRRYVQEQAITSLAMVADASEATFAKYYSGIMPLLLNVLRNAEEVEYRRLRIKAMECAGLIAIAVGRETFRPDANAFVELLIRLQKTPEPLDPQLSHYLIATWAKVCQAMGPEFEPYLPFVMPSLLATASAKADVAVYDEDEEGASDKGEREGWETINMDGQIVGVRTSGIEEKCQAFETLVIYASTLGARFAPYLPQSLEVTLPQLRFYFHDGVREACAMLLPMLLSCGKNSGTLTDRMVEATFHALINSILSEHDASFLASLCKSAADSMLVLGGPQVVPAEVVASIVDALKRQLQTLADRRRSRAANKGSGKEVAENDLGVDVDDMALLEEMEDFALEDMSKLLKVIDENHSLLVAVGSVKDLGMGYGSEDE